MELTGYEGTQPSEIILIFRCLVCNTLVRNRTTDPQDPCPDSLDIILAVKP